MVMIPQFTHAQRVAYNAKHGAGAWGQKIGKPAAAPANPAVGDPGSRPLTPPGGATPHDLRAQYNVTHGQGAAKGVSNHLLRQNFNTVHGPNAAKNGIPAPVTTQPVTTQPLPAVSTPDPAGTLPPVSTPDPAVDPNQLAQTLFPGARMFEPENYEGSPLYQFQLKAGQDQVAKSLAKRGLTNSGAAIKEELNVPMMAAAQDTDRMTRVAMDNAGRLERMQGNEAMRQERAGNTQWDREYSLAQLMAQQDPWQGALGGLDSSGQAMQGMGQDQANFLKQYYQKMLGGGGVSGVPIAKPTGPDYSGSEGAAINSNASSNNGWLDMITKALSGLI